jgi:hypothetical protein
VEEEGGGGIGKCHFGWDIIEINGRIINNRNQLETIDSL